MDSQTFCHAICCYTAPQHSSIQPDRPMPIAVSLLRGINVGGHKNIRMADLRDLYTALGMRDPRTILQSGNVVFACPDRDLARAKTASRRAFRSDLAWMYR